ncbi:hypothetical protein FEM03_08675 [Phragmitibacter flavus]|uniref:Prepilin-type N-terminal cleavage/methylation domain-containing protein n=1 Tax=Phragmitibacter flavus TaxID=2576071 RepID=A0A5R8KFB0_9BACT|nr:hypothetical protein [Phragmitibacter flavus]TLD70984.1 hypothetical protein FEM03_08675 [Phragmitibacter flavus]
MKPHHHQPGSHRARRSGFTLTETLITATIVSSALLTVIGLFSTGLNIGRDSTQTTAASLLARRIAEEAALAITTAPIDVPLTGTGTYTSSLTPIESDPGATSNPTQAAYIANWQTNDDSGNPDSPLAPGVQLLVVTVESPASVPAANRKIYRYATLVQKSQAPPPP